MLRKIEPGAFTPRQIELLETFAAQAVIALENVRLFTEIQEKSQQLEVASQHKSQFLANMSHELRTPLNAIIGYTEMMADGLYGDVGEKAQGVLERVQSNGKHLLGLINDVLDLSKIEAGQLVLAIEDYSVADMVATVTAATESLARAKGLELDRRRGARPADRHTAMRAACRRCCSTWSAMPSSSPITAGSRSVLTGRMAVSRCRSSIPAQASHRADQAQDLRRVPAGRQHQHPQEGRHRARSVDLEAHRRDAWRPIIVQSEVGKGSTFTVSIPVKAAVDQGCCRNEQDSILVIEDTEDNRQILRDLLSSGGYELIEAHRRRRGRGDGQRSTGRT